MVKKKTIAIIAGLAVLYSLTGGNPSGKTVSQKYSLPDEIKVEETDVPYESRSRVVSTTNNFGQVFNQVESDKIVRTKDIPFDKHFFIKTDKYSLSKNQDWLPSRIMGHISSIVNKIIFWDYNMGWGPDGERAKVALSILENKNPPKGLTVRLNHNEPLYDTYRLFSDPEIVKRNPLLIRATFGLLSTLGSELFMELSRGDYYNPYTKSIANYSNIESILAHEIGHGKDYARFSTDWIYSLSKIPMPPIVLFQEYMASKNASDMLSPDDSNQVYRYLVPAYGTYVLGMIRLFKTLFGKKKKKKGL